MVSNDTRCKVLEQAFKHISEEKYFMLEVIMFIKAILCETEN